MRPLALPLAVVVVACGDPETIVDEVPIDVGLQDTEHPCSSVAFSAARSVAVELQQPLGPPDEPLGWCVLELACVEVPDGSLASLDDLGAALGAHGSYFQGLPAYQDVQLQIRGSPHAACLYPPEEDPTFCGLSNFASLGAEEAAFTVELSCGVPDPDCPPPAPPCAGADL